jgi:hypothetical protein
MRIEREKNPEKGQYRKRPQSRNFIAIIAINWKIK